MSARATRANRRALAARALRLAGVVASAVLLLCGRAGTGRAASCRLLKYSFEPDCFVRDGAGQCQFDLSRPDFGPQIAVWVERADDATFVDTLMVTSAVALYGIGNRPGRWDLRSGPRFPYGRRPMALPVWAHRRGVVYPSVVMGDGRDDQIASHEEVSSPEPHFCRPMVPSEILDAITCASGNFRSSKGVFDPGMAPSPYPPRGDLVDWGNICIPRISTGGQSCDYGDARQYGAINDLDTIASATPPYDQPYQATWTIPHALVDGDYALMMEVSKELDGNAAYARTSYVAPAEVEFYSQYGLDGNVGQPSVVYRVGFQVSSDLVAPASTTSPVGYGDWTGATGTLTPIDASITDAAGSGAGRLRVIDGPAGPGRVQIAGMACPMFDCAAVTAPETPRMDEPTAPQDPAGAVFTFRQASDDGGPVIGYEMRFEPWNQSALDETTFEQWAPAPPPAVGSPGSITTVRLGNLVPKSGYAVGLRARGACGWSKPAFIRFYVGPAHFKQLSGCVVATAAYGSDLDPDVKLLRRARDWAAARSSVAKIAALLYAQSAPPLSVLVGRSDTARAVVRSLLRPLVALGRGAGADGP